MDFHSLLERRTIRRFNQTALAKADFIALIDAARRASCAANRQRLRYIAVCSPEKVNAILPLTRRYRPDGFSGSNRNRKTVAAPVRGRRSRDSESGICRMGTRNRLLLAGFL